MITILKRIQKAVPKAKLLLVSTFDINYQNTKKLIKEYVADAFPNAAKAVGCDYWDMYTFFGPYNPDQMMEDGWHCNEKGGTKIAVEMLKQLKAL